MCKRLKDARAVALGNRAHVLVRQLDSRKGPIEFCYSCSGGHVGIAVTVAQHPVPNLGIIGGRGRVGALEHLVEVLQRMIEQKAKRARRARAEV